MTLVNPLALYLLSLAGLVVLAYFLRRRGQLYRVSAFFLWQRAEERGARALRFARRSFWLLLLQLLALSLLVLALADPAYYMAGARGASWSWSSRSAPSSAAASSAVC
jgi:sterol desaturase/sphingolipid hydroxylase (fatty acid hydroxylase superfamily)